MEPHTPFEVLALYLDSAAVESVKAASAAENHLDIALLDSLVSAKSKKHTFAALLRHPYFKALPVLLQSASEVP